MNDTDAVATKFMDHRFRYHGIVIDDATVAHCELVAHHGIEIEALDGW